jgi:hypothetical protein
MLRSYLALVGLAVASGFAAANDDHLIKAQYDAQQKSLNTMNEKLLLTTIDQSFVQVSPTGSRTDYSEYVKGIKPLFSMFKSGNVKFHMGPVTYSNGTAVCDYSLEGDLVAKQGKLHVIEKGRDTWRKFSGTYKQIHEVVKFQKRRG